MALKYCSICGLFCIYFGNAVHSMFERKYLNKYIIFKKEYWFHFIDSDRSIEIILNFLNFCVFKNDNEDLLLKLA